MGMCLRGCRSVIAVGLLWALVGNALPLAAECPEIEDLGAADPAFIQADRRNPSALKQARQIKVSADALLRLVPEFSQDPPAKSGNVLSTGTTEQRLSKDPEVLKEQKAAALVTVSRKVRAAASPADQREAGTQ